MTTTKADLSTTAAGIADLLGGVKSMDDYQLLMKDVFKRVAERALQAEITQHLGYDKHAVTGKNTGNSRNGVSRKTIIADAKTQMKSKKANAEAKETSGDAQAVANEKSGDANAKAAETKADARKDATTVKRDADYAVAKEKCDALAGNVKDKCISDAKLRFGQ